MLLLIGSTSGGTLTAETGSELLVAASAATVGIDEGLAARALLQLPSLEFAFRIEANCAAGLVPDSVSINVADTRLRLGRDALATGTVSEKTLRVPAQQVAPVALVDFCVVGESSDAGKVLLIENVLSAQLSLKCVSDSRQTVFYQTTPLAIALSCNVSPPDQPSESDLRERF